MKWFLKSLLPTALVSFVGDLHRVDPGARFTFIRLAWNRVLHGERTIALPAPPLAEIVAICHGNILRSAYAEARLHDAVAKGALQAAQISSAGLHAHPGKPADTRGIATAAQHGLDLRAHRSLALDATMTARASLLLVMDRRNEAEVLARHPEAAHKVALLGAWARSESDGAVIPDPYTGGPGAVQAAYHRIDAAIDALVRSLSGA